MSILIVSPLANKINLTVQLVEDLLALTTALSFLPFFFPPSLLSFLMLTPLTIFLLSLAF